MIVKKLILGIFLSLCFTLAKTESWPYYAHDPQYTFSSSAIGPTKFKIDNKWLSTDYQAAYSSPLVGESGSVYVTEKYGYGSDQKLQIFNSNIIPNGKEYVFGSGEGECGGGIYTPFLYEKDNVLVYTSGSYMLCVFSLDTMSVAWSTPAGTSLLDHNTGIIYSLSGGFKAFTTNGTILASAAGTWSGLNLVNSTHALLSYGYQVTMVSLSLDSFGSAIWQTSYSNQMMIYSQVMFYKNKMIYSNFGVIYAVSLQDGSLAWRYIIQGSTILMGVLLDISQNCVVTTDLGDLSTNTFDLIGLDVDTGNSVFTYKAGLTQDYNIYRTYFIDGNSVLYYNDVNWLAAYDLKNKKVLFNTTFGDKNTPDPIGGIALSGNGALVVTAGAGVYSASQPIKEPIGWESILGYIFSSINGALAIATIIRKYCCKGRYAGYTSLYGGSFFSDKLNATKILFGLLSMIVVSILSGISQFQSSNEVSTLASSLANIEKFRQEYIEPCSDHTPSFNDTLNLCFCQPDYNTKSQCASYGCDRPGGTCDNVLKSSCNCEASFYDYQCNCNYNTPTCYTTTIDFGTTMKKNVTEAFNKCGHRYETISKLIWALYGINIVNIVASIIFTFVYDIKKSEVFPKSQKIWDFIIFIVSVVLFFTAGGMFWNSDSCTDINNPLSLASQLPGCVIKNDFLQFEATLIAAISATISVVVNKPIIVFGELLHNTWGKK